MCKPLIPRNINEFGMYKEALVLKISPTLFTQKDWELPKNRWGFEKSSFVFRDRRKEFYAAYYRNHRYSKINIWQKLTLDQKI